MGEQIHRAPAGTTVVVAPGTVHAFHNAADEPARLLIMVLPGRVEGFFDAARELEGNACNVPAWRISCLLPLSTERPVAPGEW